MRADKESKEITAFLTPRGLLLRKVLSMGINISGVVFLILVDSIAWDLQLQCVVVYTKDINVFFNSLEEHAHDVDKVHT